MTFEIVDTDTSTPNAIIEGVAIGTYVGVTAFAVSPIGAPVTYAFQDNAFGNFAIDASTGIITTAGTFDYEWMAQFGWTDGAGNPCLNVTVEATDGVNYHYATFRIGVENFVGDKVVDSDTASNAVSEFAAGGTYAGVTASSVSASGQPISYSIIAADLPGAFEIDPVTGVITVLSGASLDYQALLASGCTDGYGSVFVNLGVRAYDGIAITSVETFRIYINQTANADHPLIDSDNLNPNLVIEGASSGTYTGITASAYSAAGLPMSYSLVNPDGIFEINAASGQITVTNGSALDYEGLLAAPQNVDELGRPFYEVMVQATDGVVVENKVFRIYIDDFAGDAVVDSDPNENHLTEGAAPGTYTGLTAHAESASGAPMTYALVGSWGTNFSIDQATGRISVVDEVFDYESLQANPQHVDQNGRVFVELIVVAGDGIAPNRSETFRIYIDNLGMIDSDVVENNVSEGASAGTYTGVTVSFGELTGFTYSLTENPGGAFVIDSTTGRISVANGAAIDFEALTAAGKIDSDGRAYIDISANGINSEGSESGNFRIYVENISLTDTDWNYNTVIDSAPYGTYTGITLGMSAYYPSRTVTYSILDNSGNPFAIDEATGKIKVVENANFDIEWLKSHGQIDADGRAYRDVTVQASDGLNTELETFRVYVDGYQQGGLYDSDSGFDTVAGGAPIGSYTGVTARAVSKNGLEMKYYLNIARGDDLDLKTDYLGWAIDNNTGEISVNSSESIDWGLQYNFAISNWYGNGFVPHWDGQQLYSEVEVYATDGVDVYEKTFRIRLTNSANPPGFEVTDTDRAFNAVSESANGGTYFGLTAGMVTSQAGVTYSLTDNAGGRFVIDPATGRVTIANGATLDYETAGLLVGGADRGYMITIRAVSGVEVSDRRFIIRVEDSLIESASGTSGDDVLTATDDQKWTIN